MTGFLVLGIVADNASDVPLRLFETREEARSFCDNFMQSQRVKDFWNVSSLSVFEFENGRATNSESIS